MKTTRVFDTASCVKARSEFAAVVIRANPGWPGLPVDHAQSRYIGETRVDIA